MLSIISKVISKSQEFTQCLRFSGFRFSSTNRLLTLNDLYNVPGSKKKRKRWGRGTGSGRGKLCGYGHQKSRCTPRGFEGGQTPLFRTKPKIGFYNHNQRDLVPLNLEKIQQFIDMGRLIPKSGEIITIRDLIECGLISSVKDGVKLLAKGREEVRTPIHLEVSCASVAAIKALESAGGTVTSVHFNTLALRALVKPYKFEYLPLRARPPPRLMPYYLDKTKAGYLSPEVQLRNLSLFGYVTSEEKLRYEHEVIMCQKLGIPPPASPSELKVVRP